MQRLTLACVQVGYGEHYPGSTAGQLVCSACMLCGVMVLALPLIIIGNAFEETVKEEERYQREREKRLEIKMLQRFGDNDEARKVRNSSVCLSGSLARHRLWYRRCAWPLNL